MTCQPVAIVMNDIQTVQSYIACGLWSLMHISCIRRELPLLDQACVPPQINFQSNIFGADA